MVIQPDILTTNERRGFMFVCFKLTAVILTCQYYIVGTASCSHPLHGGEGLGGLAFYVTLNLVLLPTTLHHQFKMNTGNLGIEA